MAIEFAAHVGAAVTRVELYFDDPVTPSEADASNPSIGRRRIRGDEYLVAPPQHEVARRFAGAIDRNPVGGLRLCEEARLAALAAGAARTGAVVVGGDRPQ